jgi:putative acetyltransferase
MVVRAEGPSDHAAVRAVLEQAFGPDCEEAALVEALRAEGVHVPDLCLVAVDGDEVVGQVFFSRAQLESGDEVLALAPMAVTPARQREGVGSALAREALRRAEGKGFPLVVVVGHAAYYPRFGFEPAAALGLRAPFDVRAEAWMARRLPGYTLRARGLVTYAEAFGAL